MIVGVGVDVVNIPRFAATLRSAATLQSVFFLPAEIRTQSGEPRPAAGLAVRYAAKEALAKALGAPPGLHWRECEVRTDPDGRPWLQLSGAAAAAASALGVRRWHVSMAQDGDMAVAYVVAEGDMSLEGGAGR